MKIEDFKRLAVVSIDDGAKLGYVDDLLFDMKNLRVAAFHMKQDHVHGLIAMDDVRSIGTDAVTVQSRATVRSLAAENQLATLPRWEQLKKLKLVDEGGNFLGTVHDVAIDPSGRLTSIEAHEGGVLGIGGKTTAVTADEVRSVGDELIVVAVPAATKTAGDA